MEIDNQGGSAATRGELWERARDYANRAEFDQRTDFKEGMRRTSIGPGSVVLDLGCGPGAFCRLAADAGATVTGIDASPAMIEIARESVPAGRFDIGDIQFLPYGEHSFDVVTAFNSLQFAADPVAALREARRVANAGATIFIVLFGREEHLGLAAKWRALAALVPPAPPGAPGPLALSEPGVLEDVVKRSCLTQTEDGYLETVFEYPDEATMLRAQRAVPMAVQAERSAGEMAVTSAIVSSLAPYRTASGGYRIGMEWRYVAATT
jgi:SAM-dependent methyltransferase